MMAEAIRAKDIESKEAQREARKAGRQRKVSFLSTRQAFSGKVFADLTDEEKGDLLKALAVAAGIIEE